MIGSHAEFDPCRTIIPVLTSVFPHGDARLDLTDLFAFPTAPPRASPLMQKEPQ
jgi:hypothetical protein